LKELHNEIADTITMMKSFVFALSLLVSTESLSTAPDTSSRTFVSNNYSTDRRWFLGWTTSLIPSCATALTPEEASRQYDTYAPSYDDLDGGKVSVALGIEDARREMISKAKGDVLEIGVGTGTLNTFFNMCSRHSFVTHTRFLQKV
jgi:hypothetical protein